MKNVILTIISFFMLSQIAAQNENEKDTITIFINTKKIAQYIFKPGETTTTFPIKKAAAKNIKQIELQVKGPITSNVLYAGTLEIAENNILSIAETKDKPGHFNIVNATFNKLFLSGKKVPLYLMLNPANPMMMIPSKRIFLGNLIMK